MKESLESMVQYLGFGDSENEECNENYPANGSFRNIIQKFRDKPTGNVYEAVFTEYGLQCNCHEWHSRKCCKHIVYVFDRLSVRDEHGRIVGIAQKVTGKPENEELRITDFGSNRDETEEWLSQNLAVIEF